MFVTKKQHEMGMMQKATEKRFFTTYDIQKEIIRNIVTLPGINWQVQQYNYYYVVHIIIYYNTRNLDNKPGCPINSEYLAELFGKPHQQTAAILRNLVDWEIIHISEPYDWKNKKSAKYQLHPKQERNYLIMNVSITDAYFINKLISYESESITKDNFLLKSLKILKSSLTVNSNGLNYLNNKYNLFIPNNTLLPKYGYEDIKDAF